VYSPLQTSSDIEPHVHCNLHVYLASLPRRLYRNRRLQRTVFVPGLLSLTLLVLSIALHFAVGWVTDAFVLAIVIPVLELAVVLFRVLALHRYYENEYYMQLHDVVRTLRQTDASIMLDFLFVVWWGMYKWAFRDKLHHAEPLSMIDVLMLVATFMTFICDLLYRALLYDFVAKLHTELKMILEGRAEEESSGLPRDEMPAVPYDGEQRSVFGLVPTSFAAKK
jgi:hypothetical protein